MKKILDFIININPIIYIGLAFVIMIGVFITLSLRKKEESDEIKSDKREVELSDRLFKPAQVSIKFIYDEIRDSINSYIKAEANNNPMLLPAKMSKELYNEFLQESARLNQVGVERRLIHFKPEERYKVVQDNSSVYTVMFMYVDVNYKIEYFTEHSTFKRFITEEVYRKVTFEGTNDDGWVLKEVGDKEIKSKKETDV